MAHPQEARITCNECNGWYNSESELYEHMRTAHRRFASDEGTIPLGGPPPDCLEDQLVISKEEWASLAVRLRNHVQIRFNPEELDTIDRFILLASHGSIFDQLCR
jgi:hypothetical protein